jgi:hypothetical protein
MKMKQAHRLIKIDIMIAYVHAHMTAPIVQCPCQQMVRACMPPERMSYEGYLSDVHQNSRHATLVYYPFYDDIDIHIKVL